MRPLLRVLAATIIATAANAATFTVTNTNATGAGSLDDAIAQANGDAVTDTINFNIPGSGVHTITSGGYVINQPVIIDATTQPGYSGMPLIEIDGGLGDIFILNATATIRGFALTHFSQAIHINPSAVSSTIASNFIGVDADGATANGGSYGVFVSDSGASAGDTHLIGGAAAADRNVISGNNVGVLASNGTVATVSVQGNFIGTKSDGSTALPNGTGIEAESFGPVTIGGTRSNVIAFNTTSGVTVFAGSARIVSNPIYSNGTGIDNNGGNAGENPPVLTSATTTNTSAQISGTLSAESTSPYLIQFFSDPVNENQGVTIIGQTNVTTDGSGNASFNVTLGSPLTPGAFVSATATNNQQDQTSEFATSIPVAATTADLSITKTTTATAVNVGDFIDYTITVSNGGPSQATGVTVTDTLPAGTTFVSATPSQGSCSGTSTVTCSIGTLANGANATIALRVRAAANGSATNSASATANEIDPNGATASAPAVAIAAPVSVPTLSTTLLLALAAMLAAIALVRH